MTREPYFPRTVEARAEWFNTFAKELAIANAALGMKQADVDAIIADAKEMHYACGAWIEAAKNFGLAAFTGLEEYLRGAEGGAVFVLPGFNPPNREAGVAPVKAGVFKRISNFVQVIKRQKAYTESMGIQLGIVGQESTSTATAPTFTVTVEMGQGCECARIKFKKYGHQGVAVYGRRGAETEFGLLGIDTASPYLDGRDLLAPGAPEVRDYKLRFFDGSAANGEFSGVERVTIGPG